MEGSAADVDTMIEALSFLRAPGDIDEVLEAVSETAGDCVSREEAQRLVNMLVEAGVAVQTTDGSPPRTLYALASEP